MDAKRPSSSVGGGIEGSVYVAVDGRRKDKYVNTLILGAQKVYKYVIATFVRVFVLLWLIIEFCHV